MTKLSSLALAGLTFAGMAVSASADSLDRAGSLLVYPLFDNTRGGLFTVTVTNTNSNAAPTTGTLQAGTVDVEFVYINGVNCLEFNRTRRLTPNDTLTVITKNDNPNMTLGYVYVFAKSPTTGKAIKWDNLIGDSYIFTPDLIGGVDFAPVVFKAGSALAAGAETDLDNDGVRDLNGLEYEQVSDKLLVPRFVSDNDGVSQPELILIGLTGAQFTTIVDFLVYNDNEEAFSAQYTFDCWDRVRLKDINGAFTDSFLDTTNNAAAESIVLVPGAPQIETGWFRMDASIAFSTAASVQNPAFLACRIDRLILGVSAVASLPYGEGEQANGDLIKHGPFPDTN
jgi:hypothetical protein